MATSNVSIGNSWVKVAEDTDASVLISTNNTTPVEYATTTTDTAPVVTGHTLSYSETITRTLLGDGFIWARVIPTNVVTGTPTVLVVNK